MDFKNGCCKILHRRHFVVKRMKSLKAILPSIGCKEDLIFTCWCLVLLSSLRNRSSHFFYATNFITAELIEGKTSGKGFKELNTSFLNISTLWTEAVSAPWREIVAIPIHCFFILNKINTQYKTHLGITIHFVHNSCSVTYQ